MKCHECEQEFDPSDNAWKGDSDQDAVEVVTSCTHCKREHYTFIEPDAWVSDVKKGDKAV